MKLAKVVEVRDIHTSSKVDPAFTDPVRRGHVEELLRSYPHTSEAETAEILEFLRYDKHMDVGLVSGSDEFKQKVGIIRRENQKLFRVSPIEGAAFALLMIVPLAAIIWFMGII